MNRLMGIFRVDVLAILAVSFLMAGCGGTPQDQDVEADDGGIDIVIQIDTGNDQGGHDLANPDVGSDVSETSTPDIPVEIPPDEVPPLVVATYPMNEETGIPTDFVVRVTFSEDMRAVFLSADFLKLFDVYGQSVPGTIEYDATSFTVSFTPESTTQIQSLAPYSFRISGSVQDLAANELGSDYTFRFSTRGPDGMDGYREIASRYAPRLYQATQILAPQWDYPTSVNFDLDWNMDNNVPSMEAAQSLPIWVYYDVIETYTHYFIRYMYYYARHDDSTFVFGNQVSGTMVVVQKDPEEPIAVETYFGNGGFEDIRSFVTTESGLVIDDGNGNYNDGDRRKYNANWVFPKDQLFPGGHFQNYITSKSHESCAWIQVTKEDSLDFKCQLDSAMKSTLNIMHFSHKGTDAETLNTPFAYKNSEGSDVGYGLRLAIEDWWVRRDRIDEGQMFGATIDYVPPQGMAGSGMVLPGNFRPSPTGTTAGGKSPWRWEWEPATMNAYLYYTEFSEGTFFIHPAYYFAQRHRLTPTADASGFSASYCYNPYLQIDKRGTTADCSSIN